MRLTNFIYFLVPFLGGATTQDKNVLLDAFFVCYGKINPESIKGYQLVVLESAHYSPSEIAIFNENNTHVVAYISLTEVNKNASFYTDIAPFTFGENTTWNSCFMDLENKNVQRILEEEIRKIKQKGFQGLFIDNVDNVSKWGKLHHQKEAFVSFLKKIKTKHEELYLVQNAGLFLAEELDQVTNAIVVESVVSAYNFNENAYALRDVETKSERINSLKLVRKKTKKPIYLIEYAKTNSMKKTILQELKKLGFKAFISQINLQYFPKFENK